MLQPLVASQHISPDIVQYSKMANALANEPSIGCYNFISRFTNGTCCFEMFRVTTLDQVVTSDLGAEIRQISLGGQECQVL